MANRLAVKYGTLKVSVRAYRDFLPFQRLQCAVADQFAECSRLSIPIPNLEVHQYRRLDDWLVSFGFIVVLLNFRPAAWWG